MNILNAVITAEQLHETQAEIFDDVIISAQPKVVIYEGKPAIVLLSAALYQEQVTRMMILEKLAAGRKAIAEGRFITGEQFKEQLQALARTLSEGVTDGEH